MYQITKLCPRAQQFINELSGNNSSRSTIVSLAIARLMSRKLPIPSSETELMSFFNLQVRLDLEKQLSDLNEVVAIDIQTIVDFTIKFYQFRYENVYPTKTLMAFKPETAVLDIFKITKFFDKEVLEAISSDCEKLSRYILEFNIIMDELTKEGNVQ